MNLSIGRPSLIAFALLCSFWPAQGRSEDQITFLSGRLQSDDFRVRTNAALALGSTASDAAVTPLCSALDDSSEVVRQSAAAALKRLAKKAATPCLEKRLENETSAAVRLQLQRALGSLGGGTKGAASTDGAIRLAPNAKYYVSLADVANTSGYGGAERVVKGALRSQIDQTDSLQLAPPNETPNAARTVLGKRKLKGFYLSPSVSQVTFSGTNVSVRVRLAIFTYPGKSLVGEISRTASGDSAAVEDALNACARSAVEQFAQLSM